MFRKYALYTSSKVGKAQSTQVTILWLSGNGSDDATNTLVSFFVTACTLSITARVVEANEKGVVGLFR